MTKVFNKRNAKRVTAILLAVVAVVSSIFIIPTASAAGKEVTVTFDYCYDTGGNIISFVKYTEHGGYTVGTVGEELCRIYADAVVFPSNYCGFSYSEFYRCFFLRISSIYSSIF